ncbi:MAG: hypothetical protein ABI461_23385 [Polyangiaceae bacterium]
MQNRVFFPEQSLNEWLVEGTVDLSGSELTILAEARRYNLAEAVRVIQEVTGGSDTNDLVGRVKSKVFLQELGAELLETSMVLGDNAYDVIPGWIGAPIGTFDQHVTSMERKNARASITNEFTGEEPRTDEDLLARFLLERLK